jgi:hypothetical protein
MDEVIQAFAKLAREENIDDVHACPALLSSGRWRKHVTPS